MGAPVDSLRTNVNFTYEQQLLALVDFPQMALIQIRITHEQSEFPGTSRLSILMAMESIRLTG